MKEFYKTIITIEIIGEFMYFPETLVQVAHDYTMGNITAKWNVLDQVALNPVEMAQIASDWDVNPEAFGIDEQGRSLDVLKELGVEHEEEESKTEL